MTRAWEVPGWTRTPRFHQSGTAHGWVEVDGKRAEMDPSTWLSTRDRSWGLRRGVGPPVPGLRTRSDPAGLASVVLWCPVASRRPDGSPYGLHWYYRSVGIGEHRRVELEGAVERPDGTRDEFGALVPHLEVDDITRRFRGGRLDVTMVDGTPRPLILTAVGDSGVHLGPALYFGFDGHYHGEWRGSLHIDGEHIPDCTDPAVVHRLHQLRDCIVRVDDPVEGAWAGDTSSPSSPAPTRRWVSPIRPRSSELPVGQVGPSGRRNRRSGSHWRSAPISSGPGGSSSTRSGATTSSHPHSAYRPDPFRDRPWARRHCGEHQRTVDPLEGPEVGYQGTDPVTRGGHVRHPLDSTARPERRHHHHLVGRRGHVVTSTGADQERDLGDDRRVDASAAIDLRRAQATDQAGARAGCQGGEHQLAVPDHHRGGKAPVIEHERVGRGRLVPPQSELGGEHDG